LPKTEFHVLANKDQLVLGMYGPDDTIVGGIIFSPTNAIIVQKGMIICNIDMMVSALGYGPVLILPIVIQRRKIFNGR